MQNRLRFRLRLLQELFLSFRDDLAAQLPQSRTRSRYIYFHISETEKMVGVMQRRIRALTMEIEYDEDSARAVKVDMSKA